jgi:hypothetical protein
MATRMQQRRGTAAEWTSVNPVLAAGEIGFETDTGQFKIGDGTNAWADLVTYGNIESLIDAAPETLNTLNELAAAINDDPAFFTNITQDITDAVAAEATARDSAIATAKSEAISTASDDATAKVSAEATARSSAINSALSIESGLRDTAIEDAVSGIDAKIGDPTVDGTAGNTITDRISTAVDDLIAGAPGALDTLDEIAAALGDDANYAATITNTVADIQQSVVDATVSLNAAITLARTDLGADLDAAIADEELNRATAITSAIDTEVTDRDAAIAAQSLLDNQYADTEIASAISTESAARDAAITAAVDAESTARDAAIASSEATTLTNYQEYADQAEADAITTAAADATAKADAAQAAAELTASTELGTHNSDTTNVHGIADTSLLATTSDVSTAQGAAQTYADGLASNYDAAGSAAAAQTAAEGHADGAVTTHNAATTSVHGIADTSKIVMSDAVSTTLDGALVVSGDLTVNGTNFVASATSITIEDNIVQLAHTNAANTVDLGLVVAYNDGTAKHSGIVRDVSADSWKLFKGVSTEPSTTVEFTEGSLDDLAVNNVTVAGVVFTDGTQTKVGVPSITPIAEKTATYTLSSTAERDTIIEVNSQGATSLVIPSDAVINFPVGSTLDVIQTGTGQVTIAGEVGVTVNATPGLKLRTQWSSVTLLKRGANSWLVFGDTAA